MMLTNLCLSALSLFPGAAVPGDANVEWHAPEAYLKGMPYMVELSIEIPSGGASLPVWAVSPAAFSIGGKPFAKRPEGNLDYAFPTTISLSFDLASALPAGEGGFEVACDLPGAQGKQSVSVVQPAPPGLDFIEMPAEELANYWVLMQTNRGDMLMEFWPQYAPKHVANFLDLCYTGFYDGITFHRVLPGFMIQGGDPTGTGSGNGPRQLPAEFSDPIEIPEAKHVPGVLSMARTPDPNSASCQFFVMHAVAVHLDGEYSAFGKLKSGLDVVDRIVNSPRGTGDKPLEKQSILKATVLVAPKAK